MKKRESQSDHDAMVRKTMEMCINKGYSDVRADLPDELQPEQINNFKPDVTGKISYWFFIFEVETDDSINDKHTEMQWKAFADYAKENLQTFFVVVPEGSLNKAKHRLDELCIKATIIEIYDN